MTRTLISSHRSNRRVPTTDLVNPDYLSLERVYSARNYAPLDVVLARGAGVWVWDVAGNKYLDCLAAYGALNQGHNHPRLVKALIDQAQTLALTSRAFRNNRFGPFCGGGGNSRQGGSTVGLSGEGHR